MNWFDSLESFIEVAKTQSFIGAARNLQITNSAITKRIQWLETELNCSLFIRTTRKVSLTDAGDYLLHRVDPLLNEWQHIHSQLIDFKTQPQGHLKIAMPPNLIGELGFSKMIQGFLLKYPKIKIKLEHYYDPISLIDSDIDILIATEKYLLEPGQTVGVPLIDFQYQCFASKDYIKKHGLPKKPEDLKKHNCIIFRDASTWQFKNDKSITVHGNFTASSGDGIINFCKLGGGIIYLPLFFVEEEVKQKKLIPLLENHVGFKQTLKAFYTKLEYKPQKIAAFIEFVKKGVE